MDWRLAADEVPNTIITVSLAGAPGPRAGGMTPTGGRTVATPPPEATPRAMPPPPPRPVERVVPTETPRRPRATPPPEEPQPGVTRTDTGTRGQGFGLATSGSVTLIRRSWQAGQGIRGATVMRFTITRGGSIEGVMVERPSGFLALDLAAQRALLTTRLAELPPQFSNPSLTVHLTFEYQR